MGGQGILKFARSFDYGGKPSLFGVLVSNEIGKKGKITKKC